MYQIKRLVSHTTLALLEAGLVALLVVGLVAGTAFAAKGGAGKPGGGATTGGGSLSVVMVTDLNGNGAPNYGDKITFNLTTTATRPYVSVNCYQGGAWVYSASVGYFADYPWAKSFTLASSSWPAGAGDCTAQLYTSKDGIRINYLASLAFSVAP